MLGRKDLWKGENCDPLVGQEGNQKRDFSKVSKRAQGEAGLGCFPQTASRYASNRFSPFPGHLPNREITGFQHAYAKVSASSLLLYLQSPGSNTTYCCAAESQPEKSHWEKTVGLKSSIHACARLGGETGTRGWGRRVGAGQRRGRAQPTEARPSHGYSHSRSEDGRAIGHQRRADSRVLGTNLTARKTGWGQTGRWAGGRTGTSSPKSFQTTSNKAKRNKRTRKTHQTVPAEAELGSELSCAGFETEQAFCRRFLQGTSAQANTNRSLPLQ